MNIFFSLFEFCYGIWLFLMSFLKCVYGYSFHVFSAIFTKGNNFGDFLFSTLGNKIFPQWDLILKLRICSSRSKFFPLRVDPLQKEGKNENERVASPESVPIHLK